MTALGIKKKKILCRCNYAERLHEPLLSRINYRLVSFMNESHDHEQHFAFMTDHCDRHSTA